MLLIVLDPFKGLEHKAKILFELHAMSIRVNRARPDITITRTKQGGVAFTSTVPTSQLDEQMVKSILQEYKIHHAVVVCRGDYSVDDFIDVVEGNRKYVDALFVYNKIDLLSIEDIDELARRPDSVVMSVNAQLNINGLLAEIWEKLGLVRIYTKKRGSPPDFTDPLVLTQRRRGCTVEAVCDHLHKDLKREFKYAFVWGRSCKFSPQTCGLSLLIRSRADRRGCDTDHGEQEDTPAKAW